MHTLPKTLHDPETNPQVYPPNTTLTWHPFQVELLKYVFLANFLGLPSLSVPVGFDESNNGMPIGTSRQIASKDAHRRASGLMSPLRTG